MIKGTDLINIGIQIEFSMSKLMNKVGNNWIRKYLQEVRQENIQHNLFRL